MRTGKVSLGQHWRWRVVGAAAVGAIVTMLTQVGVVAPGAAAASAAALTPLRPASGAAAWSKLPTPNPSGGTNSGLLAVSCTSAAACTAVGSYDAKTSGHELPLAERWNGKTWAIQAMPSPGGATTSRPYAVSCPSASACTAVGYSSNGSNSPILAERWNGKTWAVQATPASIQGIAQGVSCPSAAACTAVGYYVNGAGNVVTLAERWNGTTWAVQRTPNPVASGSYLDGVSCRSAAVCTAVGYYYDNTTGNAVPLAEYWNGTAWALQAPPTVPGNYTELSGVSCTSASACTAVGSYSSLAGGFPGPVAERWNGTIWAMQPIPNPHGAGQLYGVSCASASACTAVGFDNYNYSAVAERWNGTAWAIQAVPIPSGAHISVLEGVSCTCASACIAVGAYTGGTLAERYGRS
jgi:hypothetical protein